MTMLQTLRARADCAKTTRSAALGWAANGETPPVANPATGETIGTITWSGAAETKAAIVFDDADLDCAVEGTVAAKCCNSGQTCVCVNRFYVQDGVYGAFAERLGRRVRALKVGDGLETGVQHGPPTNEATIGKVGAHV